jgi:hypothetical protein
LQATKQKNTISTFAGDINHFTGKLLLVGRHSPHIAFTVCRSGMDSTLLFCDFPQTEKANHSKKANEGNQQKNPQF